MSLSIQDYPATQDYKQKFQESVLDTENWDVGLQMACFHGNVELAQMMISNGARNWNKAFRFAHESTTVKNNVNEVVNLIVSHIQDHPYWYPDLVTYYCKTQKIASKPSDIGIGHCYSTWDLAFMYACHDGDMKAIDLAMRNGVNDFNLGLRESLARGQFDVATWMIHLGANYWNSALVSSCYFGNIEWVRLFINKGATLFDEGMLIACSVPSETPTASRCGVPRETPSARTCSKQHFDIVKLMLEKGATKIDQCLAMAIDKGNTSIVNLLIQHSSKSLDFDLAFQFACANGNIELALFFIEKHPANLDFKKAFRMACSYGRLDSVELILKYILKGKKRLFEEGLAIACHAGHLHVLNLMIEKGAKNWDEGLMEACRNGHLRMVKMMIEHGAMDLEYSFSSCCRYGHDVIVKYFIEKGLSHESLLNGFYSACQYGHLTIVQYLMQHHQDHILLNTNVLRNSLSCAILNEQYQIINYFLTNYYEYSTNSFCTSKSLFEEAILHCKMEVAQQIISFNTKNGKKTHCNGENSILWLLQSGVSIDDFTETGETMYLKQKICRFREKIMASTLPKDLSMMIAGYSLYF